MVKAVAILDNDGNRLVTKVYITNQSFNQTILYSHRDDLSNPYKHEKLQQKKISIHV